MVPPNCEPAETPIRGRAWNATSSPRSTRWTASLHTTRPTHYATARASLPPCPHKFRQRTNPSSALPPMVPMVPVLLIALFYRRSWRAAASFARTTRPNTFSSWSRNKDEPHGWPLWVSSRTRATASPSSPPAQEKLLRAFASSCEKIQGQTAN